MPVVYPVFSMLQAAEDLPSIQLAIEIDESLLEPLEHTSDLLQLEQVVLDLARDGLDCAPQLELLLRLAPVGARLRGGELVLVEDRKSTRLNSSHVRISYAVFCLKKKKTLKKLYDELHHVR